MHFAFEFEFTEGLLKQFAPGELSGCISRMSKECPELHEFRSGS